MALGSGSTTVASISIVSSLTSTTAALAPGPPSRRRAGPRRRVPPGRGGRRAKLLYAPGTAGFLRACQDRLALSRTLRRVACSPDGAAEDAAGGVGPGRPGAGGAVQPRHAGPPRPSRRGLPRRRTGRRGAGAHLPRPRRPLGTHRGGRRARRAAPPRRRTGARPARRRRGPGG